MTIHLKNKDIFERLGTSRHCLVFSVFSVVQPVPHTGSVFVHMLLDYVELQTNIKHIFTETTNDLLPVPQKPSVCSSLSRLLCQYRSLRHISSILLKKIITVNKNTFFLLFYLRRAAVG